MNNVHKIIQTNIRTYEDLPNGVVPREDGKFEAWIDSLLVDHKAPLGVRLADG